MRFSSLSGILPIATLVGACGQHSAAPGDAKKSPELATVASKPTIEEKVGFDWASVKSSATRDGSRVDLSQALILSGGERVAIAVSCAVNVYAREQAHRKLDERERFFLDMRAPQGGLIISLNLSSIVNKISLLDDRDFASREIETNRKNYPNSIVDTNGPVYQRISIGIAGSSLDSDVSFNKGTLRIPIVGPAMKGPTGEVGSQPYAALRKAILAKNISILVPSLDGTKFSFAFSSRDSEFWRYAAQCFRSYDK